MWVGLSSQHQGVGPHTCSETGATKAERPLQRMLVPLVLQPGGAETSGWRRKAARSEVGQLGTWGPPCWNAQTQKGLVQQAGDSGLGPGRSEVALLVVPRSLSPVSQLSTCQATQCSEQ